MKETLSKLDKLVKDGKIVEAFDTYFSDDVVTFDEAGNKTNSKAEKKILLEGFFNEFKNVNEISLLDSFVAGDKSYSNFKFIFSKNSGEKFQWDEVIIREWKDKVVVSEFYSNQDFSLLKSSLLKPEVKKAVVKKPAVKEAPLAKKSSPVKVETSETTPAVKKVAKPAAKTSLKSTKIVEKK